MLHNFILYLNFYKGNFLINLKTLLCKFINILKDFK